MARIFDFTAYVPRAGFMWVGAEMWNVIDGCKIRFPSTEKPRWRTRSPWNRPEPPQLLLRRTQSDQFELDFNSRRMIVRDITGKELKRFEAAAVVKAVNYLIERQRQTDVSIRPMASDRALFRNFSILKPTPEAVLDFANRYGMLWESGVGIPFAEWEYEIRSMRYLVEIWDATVSGDLDLLGKRFQNVGGRFKTPYANDYLSYANYRKRHHQFDRMLKYDEWPETTLLNTARELVVRAINLRMGELGGQLNLRKVRGVTNDTTADSFALALEPHDLLGALWCQFGESISDQKRYRQCEACQRHMEVSPDASRADRIYCSDACRNRAMRRRQKRVRQMRADGCTLREISKTTGSDMDTIKNWLNEKGKRHDQ